MRSLPVAILSIFCLGSAAADAATLRPAVTLHAQVVRLSDLFDDAGGNADRVLGPGPAPGGRIVVEAPQLRAIAKQFRVAWQPASSADRAVLERPGRPLRRDEALDAVKSALLAAGASDNCEIDLAGFTAPLVPLDVQPSIVASDMDYDAGAGRFSAVLSITAVAMESIDMRVGGRAEDTVELPVATTRLLAGAVLRAEDVHMGRVHTTLIRAEVMRKLDDAVGLQLKHALSVGQPFVKSELMRPAMVQKGATVQMQLDSPGLALTAQGKATESGAIGERIRILNPISGVVIEAEVTGPDHVRVAPSSPRTDRVSVR